MVDSIQSEPADRRRIERRVSGRVADLTVPEFRRILLTSVLFALILVLFFWMVRTVLIGAILAVIVAFYLRPLYRRLTRTMPPAPAALLSLAVILVPVISISVYSYLELRDATSYLSSHQDEVVTRIDSALNRLPFLQGGTFTDQIRRWIIAATGYGSSVAEAVAEAFVELTVSVAIFLFTTFYVLTDAERIAHYVRGKIAPRYNELVGALETNVRGVLYGAIFATFVTQAIKSLVVLAMNLAFHVPLAVVLGILSFVIGFFPIVGSWSVYVPVAMWLVVFRSDWTAAIIVLLVGFLGNTMFISMYVRPKLAAEKSRVLNFYWMFVGLVTGVYTFGIVGILLGPIVIGLLKAVFDTVTAHTSWRLLESESNSSEPPSLVPS